jgi:hypothetical protein
MSSVRIIAATCAVALLGVAPTASPQPEAAPGKPVTVVVRRDGGFAPRPRVYWYGSEGVAYLTGALREGQRGSFRAHVDYPRVERIVAGAALCDAGGGRQPVHAAKPRPVAMDLIVYRISVRCGDVWHEFGASEIPEEGAAAGRVRAALHELDALVPTLSWKPTQDDLTPPDGVAH